MPRSALAHPLRTARRACLLALGTALLIGAPHVARAQTFPNHVIRIVPFGTAGGPIDSIARLYGEKLKARWGQPVVVDAKPGASGTLAADAVAKARAGRAHRDDHAAADPHQQRDPAAEAAVRPGQGLRAAVAARDRRPDADRARLGAVLERRRVHRLREDASGPDLRHLGQRLERAPVRRAAEAAVGHRPRPRAVQGRGRRPQRPVRRDARPRLGQPGDRARSRTGRPHQGARHHRLEARADDAERRHLHRAGLPRLRSRQLDRRLRAGEDAAADPRRMDQRAARNHEDARRAGAPRAVRLRAARQRAGASSSPTTRPTTRGSPS